MPVYSEVGLDSFLFYIDTFNNDPLRIIKKEISKVKNKKATNEYEQYSKIYCL